MMLKIGITGGIGSGKTMVCALFNLLGIPVFNADFQARALMNEDADLKIALINLFGLQAVGADGIPDRKFIASRVFKHKENLDALNALIHPAVFRAFDTWAGSLNLHFPYLIKEAAILYESGSYLQNDLNVMVFSEQHIRLKRVQKRDLLSEAEIRLRMNRQMAEEEKMKRSDFIIYNDEQHSLIEQVLNLDTLFRKRALEPSR